ncbi:tyrosine-type recombinase/integrase [Acidovorax sp. D2M1]|uniref:Tyrosine-type recombinase/integrase n=1 Tax=Acidovorax benzenivorans TaxID=2987520 RepID=A0ABT5RVP1_9BURK|nr:integrase arm-type DNA-binding domain-containing protein [Acidovorax benzenivorans]MDD2177751.1 tyrosine-type recombinase/integrase [Acidovorax benzenivorans]
MGSHTPGKLPAIVLTKLKDGWHGDGGGLYLFVRGTSRSWVFRYTGTDGKRRNMGLGSLAAVGLSEARRLALQARQQVHHPTEPVDPVAVRRAQVNERRLVKAREMTFEECAMACIEAKRHEWKNPKHIAQWMSTLETYAYPLMGKLPVNSIDTDLVVKCLQPIWTTKTETAARLRGRIETVLAWATTSKYRQGDNPARWRGHLDTLLAKPSKIAKVEHFSALAYQSVPSFMVELRAKEGLGVKALEFAILTAARSGEVRMATWSEIDIDRKEWVIPAGRMKAGKEHTVPLSKSALDLLRNLPKLEGCELIFPSATKENKPLSDMTLTSILRRMGHTDITVHGFRSSFRDWAGDTTHFPKEVIENALAHRLKDKAEAAYARSTQLAKRRELMDAWAVYCSTPQVSADLKKSNYDGIVNLIKKK